MEKLFSNCNICGSKSSEVVFVKDSFKLVKCLSCGLVWVSNSLTKEEVQKLYSFNSNYHTKYRDNSVFEKKQLKLANIRYRLIEKHKTNGCLLDVGCATGIFLKAARENGWETYGIEISEDTSEIGRIKYDLDILTGDLEENKNNFTSEYFDVVTMWDVIEHVNNPKNMMKIVNDMLKVGGIVVISTPNIDGLFPKLSYYISSVINYWPHPEPPHHLFQFSKKTICRLLKLTDFNLLKIYDGSIPIAYSFGSIHHLIRHPFKFLYSFFFIPVALLGAVIHAGDWITVIAKKA